MKKEIYDIEQLSKKVDNEFHNLRRNFSALDYDMNTVKALKNDIFQKTSCIFIYNLKKLIQLETTQKKLAKKIGVSEDLLSKYKSGEAFPAIETLIYISECYHIDYYKLVSTPLTMADIEIIAEKTQDKVHIFEHKYFAYFFVTNKSKERNIHEGVVEINNENVEFKIMSEGNVVKEFVGGYNISDKLAFFEFRSHHDGNAYINIMKPNINKNKYVGGLGLLLLPSDANSKPCAQKLLLSKFEIDRDQYYEQLRDILSFHSEAESFGNVKITQMDDERAYDFILEL